MSIDKERVRRLIQDARFFLNEIEGAVLDVDPNDEELKAQFVSEAHGAAEQLVAQAHGLETELQSDV